MFKKPSLSFKNQKSLKAFTVIELLTIVAVVGIVIVGILIWTQANRAQARDAKRVSEVDTLRTALKLYRMDKGKYPESDDVWCSIEEDCIPELEDYLSEIPGDPLYPKEEGDKKFSYQYITENDGEEYRIHTYLEQGESYEVYSGGGGSVVVILLQPLLSTLVQRVLQY